MNKELEKLLKEAKEIKAGERVAHIVGDYYFSRVLSDKEEELIHDFCHKEMQSNLSECLPFKIKK